MLAVSKRWPGPGQQYRQRYQSKEDFELGQVQFVQVEPDTWVANMIGQHQVTKDAKGNLPSDTRLYRNACRRSAGMPER